MTRLLRVAWVLLFLLVSARVDAGSLTLAWDPNPDPDVAGYKIWYGTQSGIHNVLIEVGNATQYTIPNLPNGTYYFAVVAYNQEGTLSPKSNEVGATVFSPVTPPAPTPTPTPTPSSCTTPDPFASMGGGTCYAGGWLPPGMPIPGASPAPAAPTPAPAPAPVPSVWTCSTPDPFASMGGGTCYSGGWLPPGMPVPGGVAPAPPVTPTPGPAPLTPKPAVPSAPSTCSSPDPFAGMGGGTCYAGGWLPPGMPIPNGGTAAPAPSAPTTPAPTPDAGPAPTGDCLTPDPFVSVPGLVGLCKNGGWAPVAGIRVTGTVQQDDQDRWVIVGVGGDVYLPTGPLDAVLQVAGLRVAVAGVPEGTDGGATLLQVLSIGVF